MVEPQSTDWQKSNMAVVTHLKETDLNCNGLRGWVAVGQYYTIVDIVDIGTDKNEVVRGWIDIRNSLYDLSRQSSWHYAGIELNRPVFFNTVSGQTYSPYIIVNPQDQYNLIDILFCGCGDGEIECTACCISCCSVAGEVSEKLKG